MSDFLDFALGSGRGFFGGLSDTSEREWVLSIKSHYRILFFFGAVGGGLEGGALMSGFVVSIGVMERNISLFNSFVKEEININEVHNWSRM